METVTPLQAAWFTVLRKSSNLIWANSFVPLTSCISHLFIMNYWTGSILPITSPGYGKAAFGSLPKPSLLWTEQAQSPSWSGTCGPAFISLVAESRLLCLPLSKCTANAAGSQQVLATHFLFCSTVSTLLLLQNSYWFYRCLASDLS